MPWLASYLSASCLLCLLPLSPGHALLASASFLLRALDTTSSGLPCVLVPIPHFSLDPSKSLLSVSQEPCLTSPVRECPPFIITLATFFQVTQTSGYVCEWQLPSISAHQARSPTGLPGHGQRPHTPAHPLPSPIVPGSALRPGLPRPRPHQPRTFLLPFGQ